MRAFNYGYIVDSWGDAPYANALNAPDGGQGDLFPTFDSQETIYKGIIEELKEANTLLSKPAGAYKGIQANADILYSGNPELWRKFANSLMLRYYMRLSEKLPDYAKQGIEEIMSNASSYPVFASFEEDAMMSYVGSSNADSWPANVTYDASASNFNRIQLCAGFPRCLGRAGRSAFGCLVQPSEDANKGFRGLRRRCCCGWSQVFKSYLHGTKQHGFCMARIRGLMMPKLVKYWLIRWFMLVCLLLRQPEMARAGT